VTEAVFPDWSPYRDLDAAARAYLRDPDVALDCLGRALCAGAPEGTPVSCQEFISVLGFTLERFVNEFNGVWQEVAICDSSRLLLWHGEDSPPGEGPPGSMISSLRVVPMSAVSEVGCRRRLVRTPTGLRVDAIDVYLLLTSLEEATEQTGLRHDALRFGKTLTDGGAGQVARLEEFAELVAGLAGRPLQ
jgi:hypothetical protein